MKRSQGVYLELLFRKGVRDEYPPRGAGRPGEARQARRELRVLLDAIRKPRRRSRASQDESVAFDLVRLLTGRSAAELTDVRADLEKLATDRPSRRSPASSATSP